MIKIYERANMRNEDIFIRSTSSPDVCDIVRKNTGMNDALRIVKDQELSAQQIASLKALLTSFKTETVRGEN
jgi:hypothetical protein